jgi:hypothetical protein
MATRQSTNLGVVEENNRRKLRGVKAIKAMPGAGKTPNRKQPPFVKPLKLSKQKGK